MKEILEGSFKKEKLISFLPYMFCAYFILAPFYFFDSGMPQVADFILGVLIFIILLLIYTGEVDIYPHRKLVYIFGMLVSYIGIINLIFYFITQDIFIVQSILFYFFNFLVFVSFLALYTSSVDKRKFLYIILISIIISVVIQVFLSSFTIELEDLRAGSWGQIRQTIFFNNPNQLGYFVLLSACFLGIGLNYYKISITKQLIFYLGLLYLLAISLSSAVIIGFIILLFFELFKKPRLVFLIGLLSVVLFLGFFIVNFYYDVPVLDNIEERVTTIGESPDDNLAGRGYDRIVNHPEYLVFGSGEGAFERFESELGNKEMHSGIGTILFSYGIIGFSLFVALFYYIFRATGIDLILYLSPVLFYGLTHQNLRWPQFWLLVVFIYALNDYYKKTDDYILCYD
ncbi:O-antigen ligase family protein [Natranaerofaba carboxydovora]|uniref:O-antigen ligase family protein n=1 Tax=Natranaerofaba carboxydovora TaxID=2742683 RepID=UPI001F13B738|nr:hypothetical protein [Natranaerofaba carboxydovora]UMZ74715.1 hypothetical protein ACONDI_02315 [Natranaerofaba carboxydovora]